jgi:hypothetical protein
LPKIVRNTPETLKLGGFSVSGVFLGTIQAPSRHHLGTT